MYNALYKLPEAPYKILEHLATETAAEDFWKLIKYNSYDALSKKNLTFKEKMSLIWTPKNGAHQENYNIFFTNLIEDAMAESKSILKIYNYMVQPMDLYKSAVVFAFDFLFGGTMSLVDYNGIPVNRGDLCAHLLLSVLNGAEIGGVGKLALDDTLSRYTGAKTVIGNSKTFTGVCLYLGTLMGDAGTETGC